MVRDNILNDRLAMLRKNTQTFYAKYERVSRRNLPRNVTIKRNRTIGLRRHRRQRGCGIIATLLNTGLKFGSKFLNLPLGKKLQKKK